MRLVNFKEQIQILWGKSPQGKVLAQGYYSESIDILFGLDSLVLVSHSEFRPRNRFTDSVTTS